MPRFFVSPDDISDGIIKITNDDAHHIARSLRMAVGDTVTVCDGLGAEYTATLSRIRDDECVCDIVKKEESAVEPEREITLFMAYPKGDKLELVTQKAVELGVSHIVPFESSRCIKRPSTEKEEKNVKRLSRIAEEAAKQCGRARLPKISGTLNLEKVTEKLGDYDLALFCYEGADDDASLKAALARCEGVKSIAVIIGSEGGFSESEAESIISAGATAVTLGKRILRCETAPLFVLSAISYHFEL